jgi:hypothetical protein
VLEFFVRSNFFRVALVAQLVSGIFVPLQGLPVRTVWEVVSDGSVFIVAAGIVSSGKVLTAVPFHRIGAVKDQLEEIFWIVGQFVNGPPPATKEDHAIKYGIGRVGFEIDRIAPDAHSDLARTIFPVVGKVVLAIVVE